MAQTERGRKRRRKKKRRSREESQHYCPTEETEEKKEMKWRSGRGEVSEMKERRRDIIRVLILMLDSYMQVH